MKLIIFETDYFFQELPANLHNQPRWSFWLADGHNLPMTIWTKYSAITTQLF